MKRMGENGEEMNGKLSMGDSSSNGHALASCSVGRLNEYVPSPFPPLKTQHNHVFLHFVR